jgi:hypothetical protein
VLFRTSVIVFSRHQALISGHLRLYTGHGICVQGIDGLYSGQRAVYSQRAHQDSGHIRTAGISGHCFFVQDTLFVCRSAVLCISDLGLCIQSPCVALQLACILVLCEEGEQTSSGKPGSLPEESGLSDDLERAPQAHEVVSCTKGTHCAELDVSVSPLYSWSLPPLHSRTRFPLYSWSRGQKHMTVLQFSQDTPPPVPRTNVSNMFLSR